MMPPGFGYYLLDYDAETIGGFIARHLSKVGIDDKRQITVTIKRVLFQGLNDDGRLLAKVRFDAEMADDQGQECGNA